MISINEDDVEFMIERGQKPVKRFSATKIGSKAGDFGSACADSMSNEDTAGPQPESRLLASDYLKSWLGYGDQLKSQKPLLERV